MFAILRRKKGQKYRATERKEDNRGNAGARESAAQLSVSPLNRPQVTQLRTHSRLLLFDAGGSSDDIDFPAAQRDENHVLRFRVLLRERNTRRKELYVFIFSKRQRARKRRHNSEE